MTWLHTRTSLPSIPTECWPHPGCDGRPFSGTKQSLVCCLVLEWVMHFFRHFCTTPGKYRQTGTSTWGSPVFTPVNIRIVGLNYGKLWTGQAITCISVGNTATSSFFFLLIIWRSACLWAKALSLPWLQNNLLFTRGLSAPSTTPNLEGEGRSLSVIMLKNCPARMAPTTTGLAAAYASG